MDVVDTQVHLNRLGPLEAALAAMDAVGIASVMYEEWAATDPQGRLLPGELLPSDWAGDEAAAFFGREADRLLPAASAFVDECLASPDAAIPERTGASRE